MNFSLLKLDKEINGLMVIILDENYVTFSRKTNDYFAAYLVNETDTCLQKINLSLDFLQQNTFSDFISTSIMPDSSKSQEKDDGAMVVQILVSINETFTNMKTKLGDFSQPVEIDGMPVY